MAQKLDARPTRPTAPRREAGARLQRQPVRQKKQPRQYVGKCPAAKGPLNPALRISYLNGACRSPGTYLVLARDVNYAAYIESPLPNPRVPERVDVLGIVRGRDAFSSRLLVRSLDRCGYIALRAWRLESVLRFIPKARVRVWRGRPSNGPLKWQAVPPGHRKAFETWMRGVPNVPVWERHPLTRRWMFAERSNCTGASRAKRVP
jgi:hypothetical protein